MSEKKGLLGKILFVIVIVLVGVFLSTVDHCTKVANERAEKAQQTKNDGEMVEIDGLKWRRSTFFDEYDRCWKIYTSSALRSGEIHGQKAFAIPCTKEK